MINLLSTAPELERVFGPKEKDQLLLSNVLVSVIRCTLLKKKLEVPEFDTRLWYQRLLPKQYGTDIGLYVTSITSHIGEQADEDIGFSQYLSQKIGQKVVVYRVSEPQKLIIQCENGLTADLSLAIAALIPVIVQLFFNLPLDDDLKKLMDALESKDMDGCEQIFAKVLAQYNVQFNSVNIGQQFQSVLRAFYNRQISEAKRNLKRLESDYQKQTAAFRTLLGEIGRQKQEIEVFTGGNGTSSLCDKLIDLFESNPYLHFDNVQGNKVCYTVTAPVKFYNREAVEAAWLNTGSYLHSRGEAFAKLMKAVFLDEKFRLYVSASFELIFPSFLSNTDDGTIFRQDYADQSARHPHLTAKNCLGGHQISINECMVQGDLVGAVEQSICAVQNIQFDDVTVAELLVGHLFDIYHTSKCYECGETRMSGEQAYELIKEGLSDE